jgi:hypothetical protein
MKWDLKVIYSRRFSNTANSEYAPTQDPASRKARACFPVTSTCFIYPGQRYS